MAAHAERKEEGTESSRLLLAARLCASVSSLRPPRRAPNRCARDRHPSLHITSRPTRARRRAALIGGSARSARRRSHHAAVETGISKIATEPRVRCRETATLERWNSGRLVQFRHVFTDGMLGPGICCTFLVVAEEGRVSGCTDWDDRHDTDLVCVRPVRLFRARRWAREALRLWVRALYRGFIDESDTDSDQ